MQRHRLSFGAMIESLAHNRWLLMSLAKREVVGRYKGSVLGLLWSFFNPLLMLAVYTFAFGMIFQARWTETEDSTEAFAVILFAGLIVYNLFSECVNRAPGLIIKNANYVKKIIFPVEILPVVVIGSALFHLVISTLVWLVFYLLLFGLPHWTVLLLPLVLLPLVLFILGISWILSALGVFLRDLEHMMSVLTTALLFMSAIFYPLEALPGPYRRLLLFNPLVTFIDQARQVMIFGRVPDPILWLSMLGGGFGIAWLGFVWFQKMRKRFADVI